ncbi:hypothetical protein TEA_029344 [Camellia sinensis var. sinensis]|uniref:ACT domain-containing protein ACR n=1 Tax=Camellia sinensis var. sinensis TaxID=542762 RepID=A0A4S4E4C2_CAMSN|nr:hypothetical protein TEA_029344 [Camellia sinensis var. sinensis]
METTMTPHSPQEGTSIISSEESSLRNVQIRDIYDVTRRIDEDFDLFCLFTGNDPIGFEEKKLDKKQSGKKKKAACRMMKKIEEGRRRTQKHKEENEEASWKLTSITGQNLHHKGNEKNVGIELYTTHSHQEYYIRHMDGCTLDTEGEKERVVKCLEAAIRRRVSEGLSLELCAKDRVGLLSEVTRVFRENGLSVTRAGVTTVGEQAMNVFYMSDASGNPVDTKTIETLRKEIGQTMMLNVKKIPTSAEAAEASGCTKTSFVFGSLLERFLA